MQTIPPYSTNHTNPLLMKDDVGKGKPSTYNLPSDGFIYGQPLSRDKEGAKEVTMTWKLHQDSNDRNPNRDFTNLNKMSVSSGMYTSHVTPKYILRMCTSSDSLTMRVLKSRRAPICRLSSCLKKSSDTDEKTGTLFQQKTLDTNEARNGQLLWPRSRRIDSEHLSKTGRISGFQDDKFNSQEQQGEYAIHGKQQEEASIRRIERAIQNAEIQRCPSKDQYACSVQQKIMINYAQIHDLKECILENAQQLLTILRPYKKQKVLNTVSMQLNDFIQLYSRIQYQQTKLVMLFKQQDNCIIQQQSKILAERADILNDIAEMERLIQTPQFSATNHDLSILCGEAYKNLLNEQVSNQISNGDWDSKLESDCDPQQSEFQKVKQAFAVLEKAHLFDKNNLQLLMKCNESADRHLYLDVFLQIMKMQKSRTQKSSDILREQVLQVPCNEFSFESPLPSLRDQIHQPQISKHVQLEDLLLIQNRFMTDESSPIKEVPYKKPEPSARFQPQAAPLKLQQSFYSQNNLVRNLMQKPKQRQKGVSEHFPRSNSSHSVDRSQSTRQPSASGFKFNRKTSQPCTERSYIF